MITQTKPETTPPAGARRVRRMRPPRGLKPANAYARRPSFWIAWGIGILAIAVPLALLAMACVAREPLVVGPVVVIGPGYRGPIPAERDQVILVAGTKPIRLRRTGALGPLRFFTPEL